MKLNIPKLTTIISLKIQVFFTVALIGLISSPVLAGYDIQARGTTTGPLTKIVDFFQAVVDLLDGPLALAAVVISLVIAMAMWNFAPQGNRAFGVAARAFASGIMLFNIATIVTWLSGL